MTEKRDLNVLFICHSGQIRSQTAKDLFADKFNTKALGVYYHPNYDTINPKLEKLLFWADKVFVMKEWMIKDIIEKYFKKYVDKVECLDIGDYYHRDQPLLINILKEKVKIE